MICRRRNDSKPVEQEHAGQHEGSSTVFNGLESVLSVSQWVGDFSKETQLVSVSLKQFVWFLL